MQRKMIKAARLLIVAGVSFLLAACATNTVLSEAVLSVKDAYPTGGDYSAPVFSPDGTIAYFSGGSMPSPPTLMEAHYSGGKWGKAAVSPLSAKTSEGSFYVSPDGKKILFSSHRQVEDNSTGNSDLWVAEKTPDGWGKPVNIGAPINTKAREYSPAIASNGNLYYSSNSNGSGQEGDIYNIFFSKYENGKYGEPVRLSEDLQLGDNAFVQYVAPDESFLLFTGSLSGGKGKSDIYVSYRVNEKWQPASPLNDKVNTGGNEASARVSPDMKYLIFTRNEASGTEVVALGLEEAGIKK